MFESLVLVHLLLFMEYSGVLPTTLFADQKGLRTCDDPREHIISKIITYRWLGNELANNLIEFESSLYSSKAAGKNKLKIQVDLS